MAREREREIEGESEWARAFLQCDPSARWTRSLPPIKLQNALNLFALAPFRCYLLRLRFHCQDAANGASLPLSISMPRLPLCSHAASSSSSLAITRPARARSVSSNINRSRNKKETATILTIYGGLSASVSGAHFASSSSWLCAFIIFILFSFVREFNNVEKCQRVKHD